MNLVTGRPDGITSRAVVDGLPVRYVRTPLPSAAARRGWEREHVFGAVAATAATVSRADVVISYLYADAYGAKAASRLTGHGRRPVVLKLTGAVPRRQVWNQPVAAGLLRRALDTADEVWVNSPYVVEAMAEWGREMLVVPAGVDVDVFRPVADRTPEPTVLCTAAPDEPRKRVGDLLAAWPAVRGSLPGATLVLAQAVRPDVRRALLDAVPARERDSIRFVGRLGDEALVAAYSSAWVTVAPAAHEALGLATLESLACGTPVVGADSGATPDLLRPGGSGATYRPGEPDALTAAIVATAARAHEPDVREVCRSAALPFAWEAIVDEYERRLARLLTR